MLEFGIYILMGRRNKKEKRNLLPDPKYKNVAVAKFVNILMMDGKRSTAQKVVYGAFDIIREKTQKDPIGIFSQALRNVSPLLEVKSRRVGGANYQVPVEKYRVPVPAEKACSPGHCDRLPAFCINVICLQTCCQQ